MCNFLWPVKQKGSRVSILKIPSWPAAASKAAMSLTPRGWPGVRCALTKRVRICLLFTWKLCRAVIPSGYYDDIQSNFLPLLDASLPSLSGWSLKVRGSDCLRSPGTKRRAVLLQKCPSFSPVVYLGISLSLKQFHFLLYFILSILDSFLFLILRHTADCFLFLTPKPHKVKLLLSWIMDLFFPRLVSSI